MTKFLLGMKKNGWKVLMRDPELQLTMLGRICTDDESMIEYKWMNDDGPDNIRPCRLDRKVIRLICGAFCRQQFEL